MRSGEEIVVDETTFYLWCTMGMGRGMIVSVQFIRYAARWVSAREKLFGRGNVERFIFIFFFQRPDFKSDDIMTQSEMYRNEHGRFDRQVTSHQQQQMDHGWRLGRREMGFRFSTNAS